jgi:glycosyltransferase involved in cell wall biosynthesis
MSAKDGSKHLRILHVLRSPVGGLFRHVCDLTREQARAGHDVGIVCDSLTGGSTAESALRNLAPFCSLGITRLAMRRLPHPSDASHTLRIRRMEAELKADILHGHGAKGGLYARIASHSGKAKSVYTPHGGSLHYEWASATGLVFLTMEKVLTWFGSNYVFVCDFEKRLFDKKIGIGKGQFAIVQNGLTEEEFEPVNLEPGASDFLFVGEMRKLKGVDVLLTALSELHGTSLTLVGDGSDQAAFEAQAQSLGIESRVRFAGRMPIRAALAKGDVLVVPSRNESFPYVVLEGAAAGRIVIASRVGGIPEILPEEFCVSEVTPAAFVEALRNVSQAQTPLRNIASETRKMLHSRNSCSHMASMINQFYEILLVTE